MAQRISLQKNKVTKIKAILAYEPKYWQGRGFDNITAIDDIFVIIKIEKKSWNGKHDEGIDETMPGKKFMTTRPNLLLRKAREARGWTQQEVADFIGAPYPFMVSRWENSVTSPNLLYRQKLAELFEKTPEELGLLPVQREHHLADSSVWLYDPAIPLPLANAQELIGRGELIDDLRQRFSEQKGRVQLALNGLPGVGKTTLAVQLANDEELQATFKDGILWAGLGPQPNLLALFSRWGNLLGISGSEQMSLRSKESWIDWLHQNIGTRRMLIVIDDAWTLDDALSCIIGGPNCAYLLTTRLPDIALRFAGTLAFHVQELDQEESMQLLTQLAPDLKKVELAFLHPLVQASGGLPLALTLLGHHLLVQTNQKGSRRLRATLDRLRQAEERIQLSLPQVGVQRDFRLPPSSTLSLQAIIGLSEAGLQNEARQMLFALAVFPTKPESFTEEAAMAVAHRPVEFFDKLVDAGLVECAGLDRYTLHQTVADYARTQYHDSDAEKRLARYYIELLVSQQHNYALLEPEIGNILHALQMTANHQLSEEYLQGVLAFIPFLQDRAMYQLAEQLLEQARQMAQGWPSDSTLIALLLAYGRISLLLGKYQKTEIAYQEALQLARQNRDQHQICFCLLCLGGLVGRQGDHARTEAYFQEGLQLARQLDDTRTICQCLHGLGTLAVEQGKYALASTLLSESLALARQLDSDAFICALLNALGAVAADQADFPLAEQYWQEALTRARQAHLDDLVNASLTNLGSLATEQGNFSLAEEYIQGGLLLARRTGSRERMVLLYETLGSLLRKQQKNSQALAALQEGLDLARRLGHRRLLGKILLAIGELALQNSNGSAAEEAFREIIEQMPEAPHEVEIGARYGLAQLAALQGRVEEAQKLGEQCLAGFTATGNYRTDEVRIWLQRLPALHISALRCTNECPCKRSLC